MNKAIILKQGWPPIALGIGAATSFAAAFAAPVVAQEVYRQEIAHDLKKCSSGAGPAVKITIHGIKSSEGTMRVQSYRGVKDDWLKKGKWIYRIEAPAKEGTMTFCMPLPAPGEYGIAVRHDTNGNGKTEISKDGGGMSNDPSINIFNLGKPSYKKTKFDVGKEVKAITINMKYW